MATCNFSLRYNSNFLYAFCEGSDFDEYLDEYKRNNEIEEDEDDDSLREALYSDWYDDEKEYYLNWLEEELDKLTSKNKALYSDFTELRAYNICDGDEIATVQKCIEFAGTEFSVCASINFEAGYYEGFALDWNVKSINAGYYDFDEMPDLQDCQNMLEDETDLNAGLCKALAAKLQARLQEALDEITGTIEKALQTVSPYHLTGFCMSNGEGIYTNHKEDKAA